MKHAFIADFENACAYPLEIVGRDYSNAREVDVLKQRLAPGEIAEVLSRISFSDTLELSIPDAYRLSLTANGNTRSLDKQSFLAQLKRAEYRRKGNAIHIWSIRDPSLCP